MRSFCGMRKSIWDHNNNRIPKSPVSPIPNIPFLKSDKKLSCRFDSDAAAVGLCAAMPKVQSYGKILHVRGDLITYIPVIVA